MCALDRKLYKTKVVFVLFLFLVFVVGVVVVVVVVVVIFVAEFLVSNLYVYF